MCTEFAASHCVNTYYDEVNVFHVLKCAKMSNFNCANMLYYILDEVLSGISVADDCVASISPGPW